ncbi:MAG: hypothetical protein WC635_12575 [Bacteriovorax sp.]|jgi:hypothetical protein
MKSIRSLKEFLVDYPHFRIASLDDNSKVLDFYQKNVRTSPNSLIADRSPDFFKLLRDYSDSFYVIIGVDESNEVDFVCSITLSMTSSNKQIGFLRDLRFTQNSPALLLNWVKLYSDFMQDYNSINEFQNLERIFSLSYEVNESWKNIFSIFEKKNVFYHKIATIVEHTFSNDQINGPPINSLYQIDASAHASDKDIKQFIDQELVKSYLGRAMIIDQHLSEGIVCRDKYNNIVGLLITFDSSSARSWKSEGTQVSHLEARALIKNNLASNDKTAILESLIHAALTKANANISLLADENLLGRKNQRQVYDFYEITNLPQIKIDEYLGIFNIIN